MVAIITGAGAGLGKDYAINLANRGAKVVVNDLGGNRNGTGSGTAAADQVVEEIHAFGGEAVSNYDTVATVEGGENIVKTALEAFGKVDILINNAGIIREKTFVEMDEEAWDAVVAVHMKGAYCVTRPAFINMKENDYGRIVMTSSASGMCGHFGHSSYGAAKMAVAGLVNVLKLEGAKHNIKVNVLIPAAGTRMTEDLIPPEIFETLKVDYVTPAALYLCSEQCEDTGVYMFAQAGHMSRAAIQFGPGVDFPDIPTVEQVQEKWDQIMSMEGAQYYEKGLELFMKYAQ